MTDHATWVCFQADELGLLRRLLASHHEANPILNRLYQYDNPEVRDPAYRAAAERMNCVEEGVCEIDDKAVVSHSDDGGAYVMAWVWVGEDDL